MNILRERHNQALVKVTDHNIDNNYSVSFEWWYDIQKMREGIKLEEIGNKTYIYCFVFKGSDKEAWLINEFDRRVPKIRVV